MLPRGSSRPRRRAEPRRHSLQITAMPLPPVLSTAPRPLKTSPRSPRSPRSPHLHRCPHRSSREGLCPPSRIRSLRIYPTRTTRHYMRGIVPFPYRLGAPLLQILRRVFLEPLLTDDGALIVVSWPNHSRDRDIDGSARASLKNTGQSPSKRRVSCRKMPKTLPRRV